LRKNFTGIPSASVGTDIEEVYRFRSVRNKRRFLKRVFSERELSYFRAKGNKAETLAGIFASKEAVVKALTQLLGVKYTVADFEINHDKQGFPIVSMRNSRKGVIRFPRGLRISLSITHTRTEAFAVVIAQKP
jgi:holo-[acyl-carrier protein] synthase